MKITIDSEYITGESCQYHFHLILLIAGIMFGLREIIETTNQ